MLEEPSREDAPSQDQEQGSVLSCINDVDEHNHDHHTSDNDYDDDIKNVI